MSEITIRPAVEADLPRLLVIAVRADDVPNDIEIPTGSVLARQEHLLVNGDVLVAEVGDGELAGYAATLVRDGARFLAQFYVLPEYQSAGIGRTLMARSFPDDGLVRGCVSSHDPRAIALYVRFGMLPQWPWVSLEGTSERLRQDLPAAGVSLSPAELGPELLDWDARISGRHRPEDFQFWVERLASTPYWVERAGRRIGYGVIQELYRSDDAQWCKGLVRVGPVGVEDPADAVDTALALAHHAAPLSERVQFELAGSHPAIALLLATGCRVRETLIVMASCPEHFGDPRRYIPSSGALY